jgi:hypothetical protein
MFAKYSDASVVMYDKRVINPLQVVNLPHRQSWRAGFSPREALASLPHSATKVPRGVHRWTRRSITMVKGS